MFPSKILLLVLLFSAWVIAPAQSVLHETSVNSKDFYLNHLSPLSALYPNLTGSTGAVSVKELNADPIDPDLYGRVQLPDSALDISDHSTAMASLIAGAGVTSYFGKGLAPDARIISVGNPQWADSTGFYQKYRIGVQNHSYGALDPEPYYGIRSALFDASANTLPHLLHVVSAGNKGSLKDPASEYLKRGFGNITGSFKMAKNIIVAGAQHTDGSVPDFSSRGPAYDGRILPHVVAHGLGTSESAALVSGLSLLLQAYYQQNFSGRLPPSSLIKSILISGASDAGVPGLDYAGGYGAIDGLRSLEILSNENFRVDSLNAGDPPVIWHIPVPSDVVRLHLTLVWNDPAAEPLSTSSLVNDLDMDLTGPDGERFLPWILSTHPDSLTYPAKRGKDRLNNVEWITIDRPAAGMYSVRIEANRLLAGSPQVFALSWLMETVSDRHWTFPDEGHPLLSGRLNALSWRATGMTAPVVLEWSPDLGQRWLAVDENVDPASGRYFWTTPDTLCAALLRLRSSNSRLESDTFFIAPACKIQQGFTCADSIEIRWPDYGPDFYYQPQTWEAGVFQPWGQTTRPYIIAGKTDLSGRQIAVQPVHRGLSAQIHRSELFEIPENPSDSCYLVSFFAAIQDGATLLTSTLNSTYQVSRMVMTKLGEPGAVLLELEDFSDGSLFFEALDPNPRQGTNTYRLDIFFRDSSGVISRTVSVVHSGAEEYLLFPNPASSGQTISLLRQNGYFEPETFLEIWDMTGRLIYRSGELSEYPFSFQVPGISNGMYLYGIRVRGRFVERGRVFWD